jgi:uncharacterized protein
MAGQGLDLMKLFALRAEFGTSAKKGDVIYAPGQAADTFFVVMKGRVQIDRPGFESQIVAPGDLFGEVEAFTDQARVGQASALDDCNLLSFTRDSAIKLAEATPSFALVVIRKSCERVARAESLLAGGAAARPATVAPAPPAAGPPPATLAAALPAAAIATPSAAAPLAPAPAPAAEPAQAAPSANGDTVGPVLTVDYAPAMWKKDVKCPNCRTTFHAWNVRSQAINLTGSADSDLMNHYNGPDPNWYAVWVCPNCNLAAYADDFGSMQSVQVARVKPALEEVKKADPAKYDFSYYRDEGLALRSYQLAVPFYEGQRGGVEKVAGLYHRMAWIERSRGNTEQEKVWLDKAREGYEKAFTTSDAGKQGVLWAYMIGEINMRIGRYQDSVKWFGTAAAQPDFKSQPMLEKMVRDRWSEAGDLAKTTKATA